MQLSGKENVEEVSSSSVTHPCLPTWRSGLETPGNEAFKAGVLHGVPFAALFAGYGLTYALVGVDAVAGLGAIVGLLVGCGLSVLGQEDRKSDERALYQRELAVRGAAMGLRVANITKRFRDVTAVNGLSFAVERGRILGFLGPNGAGKTTTMRVILGIIQPDEGEVAWNGRPLAYWGREFFGYLPEERGLYPKMPLDEHLIFLGRINGLSHRDARDRAAHWIDRFRLGEYRRKRIEELSKGNQQKAQVMVSSMSPNSSSLMNPSAGLIR